MKKTLYTMAILSAFSAAQAQSTLASVKSKGELVCGASQGIAGFSVADDKNNWSGIDVDFCRAVASAIFDDPSKARFVPLSAKERFTAIQSGEVDLLSRNTTETMSRDATLGLNFVGVTYYDGQGFMVRKSLGVSSAKELDGAAVCTDTGTTTELNINDYFKANNLAFKPVVFEKKDEVISAYDAGRCDVVSTDISGLESYRISLKTPADHIILPEVISKEPLAPAVRHGDDSWLDLVEWSRSCMINAEELGVTSSNVEEMKKSDNPNIKRLVGVDGEFGKSIGLSENWCASIIKHVGNYGEMYDRNLGPNAATTIDRGLNRLWNDGGIMYAAPIR